MNVQDYSLEKLIDGLREYQQKLWGAQAQDKRRKQTKLDIVFYQAMVTLFNTEISNRLPL